MKIFASLLILPFLLVTFTSGAQTPRSDLNGQRLWRNHTLYFIDEGKARRIVAGVAGDPRGSGDHNLWDDVVPTEVETPAIDSMALGSPLDSSVALARVVTGPNVGTLFLIERGAPNGPLITWRPITARGDSTCKFSHVHEVTIDAALLVSATEGRIIDYTGNGLVDDHYALTSDAASRDAMRSSLKSFIWGLDSLALSEKLPLTVIANYAPEDEESIPEAARFGNLKRVDRLDVSTPVRLPNGSNMQVESFAYVFIPKRPNGRAAIVHDGHNCRLDGLGDESTAMFNIDNLILKLNGQGFVVVGMRMPFYQSTTLCKAPADHGPLMATELGPGSGSPLRFFLEPVLRVTNYLIQQFPGLHGINMAGLSGGGWTATLYPAVDTRIERSAPVAGSMPLYLRTNADIGDAEQIDPIFYAKFGYKDLYILSASGHDRVAMQILNQRDNCCFGESQYNKKPPQMVPPSFSDSVADYTKTVLQTVRAVGEGQYCVHIDTMSVSHQISLEAVDQIVALFENKAPVNGYCINP